MALREASVRPSPASSPSLRQTKSAFQLSPRIESHSSFTSPPLPSNVASSGFFGWTRWYKQESDAKVKELEMKQEQGVGEPVSDEVTRLFKEAFRKRKALQDEVGGGYRSHRESGTDQEESFEWPEPARGSRLDSTETSVSGITLSSLDLDDFPSSSPEFSPPRIRRPQPPHLARSTSSSTFLRSTQSNVTLKAPQLLRRVSSSASILTIPVELPPQTHSSPSSPTLPIDEITFSPTLLSYSTTSSVSSESTSRSSSSNTTNTSRSTASSAKSDSSFRSRFSTLRKAASSAALNFFVPKEPAPPLPPTASTLLQNVLLKHDHSTPDSPSSPSPYFSSTSDSDSYSLDSPSSAFPPFDPFASFDEPLNTFPPTSPSLSTSTTQPRLLARQRSFIDPHTRSLRTAPSLLCTPPTPDKSDPGDFGNREREGSGSDESGRENGGKRSPSRRKRGKRKGKSSKTSLKQMDT
ncbi:hypothetical protein JCM5353_005918 [Sporobolomyces roseus]